MKRKCPVHGVAVRLNHGETCVRCMEEAEGHRRIRAITLTQPYATLVAYGEKAVETRSWRTPYRGLLAIHAGVGLEPVGGMSGLVALMESEPFAERLRPHVSGYTPEERARDLPRGAIVALVELLEIRRLDRPGLPDDLRHPGRPFEEAFGDYRAGRYAWTLQNRLNLYDGVECRGALGAWKVPKEAFAEMFADADDELREELGVR